MTLEEIFQENTYPESVKDKFFKSFSNNLHIVKPTLTIAEKKCLLLVLLLIYSYQF